MAGSMLPLTQQSVGQSGHHVVQAMMAMMAMLELPRAAQIPLLPRGKDKQGDPSHPPASALGCWFSGHFQWVCKPGVQQHSKQHHKAPQRRPQHTERCLRLLSTRRLCRNAILSPLLCPLAFITQQHKNSECSGN